MKGATPIFDTNNTVPWQYSGLPEGSAKAKSDSMTMFADVTQAPYFVDNTGAGDQSLKIQAAYNACPSNQYIYLPPGTYSFSTNITMTKSGVEIRGAGSRTTFMKWIATSLKSQMFLWNSTTWNFDWLDATNYTIHAGFTKLSTNIHVFTNDFKVGSIVLLDERVDGVQDLDRIGATSTPTWTSRSSTDHLTFTNDAGRRAHQQIVFVTALSGNGQTNMTFWPPIAKNYTAANLPMAIECKNWLRYGGLRGLSISNTTDVTMSARDHVFVGGTVYGWIMDCEIALMRRRVAWHYNASYMEYSGNFFHHGIGADWTSAYDPDRAYGFYIGLASTGNRIIDNSFWKTHFACAFEGAGPYNVFGYNYVTNTLFNNGYTAQPSVGNHAVGEHFNLIVGNWLESKILCDNFFGNALSNTVFRNIIFNQPKGGIDYTTNMDQYASAIDLFGHSVAGSKGHYNYSIVANLLGTRGLEKYYEAPEGINPLQETGNYNIYRMGHTNSNVDNYSQGDTGVKESIRRIMNWDSVTITNNGVVIGGDYTTNDLPACLLFVDGEPNWGQAEGWTIRGQIGPHIGTNRNAVFVPARERFMALQQGIPTNYLTRRIHPAGLRVRGIRR